MGLSKSDYDKLDSRIKRITEQAVEQIEVDSDLPPTIDELEDNNKTYSIMAAILFIDIRKSTYLTENSQAKSMVKIYRSFMRMAVECVRKNGGVTRQFLGDRIMGVFVDSIDENGVVSEKAVDKAMGAARSLQTVIDFSLNKRLKSNVNGKVIECGIGIDYGKVLVTQVGMYGVEQDENKENEVDCVWVGNTTNYASKYSDIALGGEIFISENVYGNLSDEYKAVWTKSAKYKGTKLFQGYVTSGYYLDFFDELGNPIKIEKDSTAEIDTSKQLADGIKEVERLQNQLIKRERELAVLEDRLKRENEKCQKQYTDESKARLRAQSEKEDALDKLNELRKDYFKFIDDNLLNKVHSRNYSYVDALGKELVYKIINKAYDIGKMLGKSYDEITKELDCYLIEIYSYYKEFSKAYDVMVIMAENADYWVYMDIPTLKWANDNHVIYKVYNEIERGLVNYRVKYERRKDFEGYLKMIRDIRGY
jgi:class 3 adenylate cyclase